MLTLTSWQFYTFQQWENHFDIIFPFLLQVEHQNIYISPDENKLKEELITLKEEYYNDYKKEIDINSC